MESAVFAVLAAVAFAIGRWGQTRVKDLVPPALDVREQIVRERTMRRGTIVCQLVGVVLALGAVLHASGALGH